MDMLEDPAVIRGDLDVQLECPDRNLMRVREQEDGARLHSGVWQQNRRQWA